MRKILRTDEQLQTLAKPQLQPESQSAIGEGDVLVVCAGFEERAVYFLRQATSEASSECRVVVIEYRPHVPENRLGEVSRLCRRGGVDQVRIIYDRRDPTGAGESLVESIGDAEGRIFLDVSGMSRLLIVQALVALAETRRSIDRTSVLYAEALEYPPSEDEVEMVMSRSQPGTLYEAMFLSSGVFGITVLPELSTVALQGQPLRVVAFPSFNVHQLMALRLELQPSHFTLIHGQPHLPENAWRLEAIKKLNRTTEVQPRDDLVTSTLDYRETLDCLLSLYAEHGASKRMAIAPTGSKMQAVAVGIFRSFMRDVQIVYPTPREFARPEHYTRGVLAGSALRLDAFAALASGSGRQPQDRF